jgi:hypothetical protein
MTPKSLLAILSLFALGAAAGTVNPFKKRETCYQVDCNPETGECQGTLPDCERGYCIESTLVCQWVRISFRLCHYYWSVEDGRSANNWVRL